WILVDLIKWGGCRFSGPAVIDARYEQEIEGLAYVVGRAFLAGVRDDAQPLLASLLEHALELARRVAALAGVEADADEFALERQRRLERRERVLLRQVAQEAQDEVRADVVAALRVAHRVVQAADHDLHRDAARGVSLRIEEQLGVHHAV